MGQRCGHLILGERAHPTHDFKGGTSIITNISRIGCGIASVRTSATHATYTEAHRRILHLAMRRDVAMSDPTRQPAIVARVQSIQTRGEAAKYIQEVQAKLRAAGQALA